MSFSTLAALLNQAEANLAPPVERASGLPGPFYTDETVFAAERRAVFEGGWLFVGRAEQLPEAGDYRALETPAGPVLLLRGEDGTLRAFANICRHRGSLLLEGNGRCRRIVCPYHAWTYGLDGALLAAPDMKGAEDFDKTAHGLLPIRLESWAGFLFVTVNEDAPALLESLGDLPQRMASHRLDEMRHVWSMTLDCACNWKLLLENAMEAYHTGLVHRETVGAQKSRDIETEGDWLCFQVLDDRSIATLPGTQSAIAPIPGLDADARQGTYFTILWPTCQLVMAQDCLWWLNVLPLSANRSRLEIGGCFPADTVARPDFEDSAAPYLARWEAVAREDVGILEKQQHALASSLQRPGRFSPRERQLHLFGRRLVAALRATD